MEVNVDEILRHYGREFHAGVARSRNAWKVIPLCSRIAEVVV